MKKATKKATVPDLTPDQWQQFNMLQTIITHFSKDPEGLRAYDTEHWGSSVCSYTAPTSKPKSIGCAIGMFLSDKKAEEFEQFGGSIEDLKCEAPEIFPKWLIAMDVNFLQACQDLHDISSHWDVDGLSFKGKRKVAAICNNYALPYDLLMEPLTQQTV